MCAVLPVPQTFFFEGGNKYLEGLDAPQLDVFSKDLHGKTIYDVPHFSQFIGSQQY
jgi:hypothetical protein